MAVIATACSPAGASPPPSSTTNGPIAAALSEWEIGLSATSAPAGDVSFAITNQGTTEHEFLMIRTDMMAGSLPVKNGMLDVEAMGGPMGSGGMDMPGTSPAADMDHPVGTVGVMDDMAAGATGQLNIDELQSGHYVIICNLPAHYEQGMRIDFTVGP